jgi:hypothetical protein
VGDRELTRTPFPRPVPVADSTGPSAVRLSSSRVIRAAGVAAFLLVGVLYLVVF